MSRVVLVSYKSLSFCSATARNSNVPSAGLVAVIAAARRSSRADRNPRRIRRLGVSSVGLDTEQQHTTAAERAKRWIETTARRTGRP